jgi:hypothetical protein
MDASAMTPSQIKNSMEVEDDIGNIDQANAEAENAALRDDAERYRFIRKVNAFAIVEYCGMFGPKELKGKKLDKAIDAARKK